MLRDVDFIELPHVKENVRHVWHIYTVLLDVERDKFFRYMKGKNIGVNVHYIPAYHFSYYQKHLDFNSKNFPVTEDVFNRVVTLPLFPKMRDNDVLDVVTSLKKFID